MTDLTAYVLPTKEQIQYLPKFENLPKHQILVINTLEQCVALHKELSQITVFGFDSESKPTFQKGEVQTGPHLIQLATSNKAYLFQMNEDIWQFLAPLFANSKQLKVGFGLKNDKHLFLKRGIELEGVIELSKCFRHLGIKQSVGVKSAVAQLLGQQLMKSKKISTSNWSNKKLSPAQIDYAAADAYACILIYKKLCDLDLKPQ
jgi:ribonuclease D